jgi:hypothetical protein
MLFLSLRRLSSPLPPTFIQSASYVTSRKNRVIPKATDEPTRDDTQVNDSTQVASNAGMDQLTNILDNASSSGSPQSNTFNG